MRTSGSDVTPALHGSFFRARLHDGEVRTEGQARALLGHRIESDRDEPAGTWVEWRWDGEALTVARDRFGAHPLFYAAADDRIVVSPSIARVLEADVSRALDLDALAAFVAIGYYLGSDTPFREIRALAPGATLRWRPGRTVVTGAPQPFQARPMGRAEIIDGIIETVRAAVARCIPAGQGHFIMPVSGGRDSRHILLELHRQGHVPAMCVTAGHYPTIGGGEDRRIAKKLCRALGLEHRRVPVTRSLVDGEMRKNRLIGLLSDEHSWSLPLIDALVGRTDHAYDGLAGGIFLSRPWEQAGWLEPASAGRFDELAWKIVVGKDGRDRFSDLVGAEMRSQLTPERAAERVRRALETHRASANPTLDFRFWERGMRELALVPNLVLSGVPTVYTPYLDPEFVGFASSIPVRSIDRSVHDEAIARAFPQVADVRYARFGRPSVAPDLMRSIHRDLARILTRHSDGSLVDRGGLLRRALRGAITGAPGIATGRRPSLIAYLVQLEGAIRDGPGRPP